MYHYSQSMYFFMKRMPIFKWTENTVTFVGCFKKKFFGSHYQNANVYIVNKKYTPYI